MGLLDMFRSGPRCYYCGEKKSLHVSDPPTCDRCYWRMYRRRKGGK